VGGDWYDVFTLPEGRLGVVVGDVAGSGLAAAVTMGRMRSALRAYVLETADPADDPGRRPATAVIQPGALLCCFTDGLVERRDEMIDLGIGRVAATLGSAPAQDDTALLMLHRHSSCDEPVPVRA
jgi:sigma-B regulation protein RsbU (phosphoserine phosphatase)